MRAFANPPDLSALRASYLMSLQHDLNTLEGLQSEVEFGFDEPRTYEDLRRLAHVQAGNAATFGFADLGHAARAVDVELSDRRCASATLPSLLAAWREHLRKAAQT